MGKKVKKAVKKVTKVVKKTVNNVGEVAGGAIGAATGGVLGGKNEPKVVEKETSAPAQQVAAPTPGVAATVEAPKEESYGDDETDSEAAKKKARAGGKKGLSVARASGTGINI